MNGMAVRALREENDALRARVADLEASLMPPSQAPREWGLTVSQKRMFRALAGRAAVSLDGLRNCCVGHTDDGRTDVAVRQQVSLLRRRLAPFGYRIEAVTGPGYRLVKPEQNSLDRTTDLCVDALRRTVATLRRVSQ